MHVEPGGPADVAGVLLGDVLIHLAGRSFDDLNDLHDVLRQSGIGENASATLIRGGQKQDFTIKIGERPLR